MSLIAELKRRNVFKVSFAYAIVAWLLLQVSDALVPALHLPQWFNSGVVFVLIIGFPIALIFAWAFEMTPERINVQLIDAYTDEHLWAEIFDRKLTAENLFAIQSEISQAIATALQATLSPEETRRINSMPTDNLQAYNAYLRGRQLVASRLSSEIEQAIEKFNKAVELDPEFALAWVGVADSHLFLTVYGTLNRETANAIREEAIERALTLDDSLGEAYASLGTLLRDMHQPKESEEAFQKAINLSPNYATAWHWYSTLLEGFPMRSQQSLEFARKAVELDPRSMIIGDQLGNAYEDQGLYALAERQNQKVIALHPDSPTPLKSLAGLYLFEIGQFDKAVISLQKAIELDPGNTYMLLLQALTYIQLGDLDSADLTRRQIEEIDRQHRTLASADVAIAYASGSPAAYQEHERIISAQREALESGAEL